MPKFQMEGALAPDYQSLPEFVQGYIEAMFFTECETGSYQHAKGSERQWNPETDSALPGDVGFGELASETVVKAQKDCADFQEKARAYLERAYETGMRGDTYDAMQAGRDFWFTRNSHGVGFWDRGLAGFLGDVLTDMAHAAGSRDAYMGDDGKVYIQ